MNILDTVKKLLPRFLLRYLSQYRRHWVFALPDFLRAKRRVMSSVELTDDERELLDHVSLEVHVADSMYIPGHAYHYLSVGLSAIRCISAAIRCSRLPHQIDTVLDFPCGYGRVLRFLRRMFPSAHITAAEICGNALDFCGRAFSTTPLLSATNFDELAFPQRFDLIWCGSLLTHIDESSAIDLLRFFHDHLSERGLCIFTAHGRRSIDIIQDQERSYGLTNDARRKITSEFQKTGYGYADYPNQSGYGISVASRERMIELAKSVGGWSETLFIEHGWDNHQDVYAFATQMLNNRL